MNVFINMAQILRARVHWQCSFRCSVSHALQEPNQVRPTGPTQQTRRRHRCTSSPRPNTLPARAPLGSSHDFGAGGSSNLSLRSRSSSGGAWAAPRRPDDIERHDAKVGIAEATERVHSSVIRLRECGIAHPRYG